MNPEHQRIADEWSEKIRTSFANAIGKRALQVAEFVGKHYEMPFDYRDEEDEDDLQQSAIDTCEWEMVE